MDRSIVYPGAVPLAEDLLNTNRAILIALGLLAQDVFGTSTLVGGCPCTPTAPGSLNVQIGPGRIYSYQQVDPTAYSSLTADTVNQIVKQGINFGTTTLACAAPVTVGQSINYLIEAAFTEADTTDVVLSYYNATNPASPLSGPGNSGAAQPTKRQGAITLAAKPGVPAPTGSQTTPAADSGYVGLYVVTVAFGQTAISGANIAQVLGAPFITGGLLSLATADLRYLQLTGGTLTGPLVGTTGTFSTSVTVNGISVNNASILTGGLIAAARLGSGAPSSSTVLLGNSTWSVLSFSGLSGSIGNGQVPSSAVTQWQASLTIGFGQLSGSASASQIPFGAVAQWQGSLTIGWGQISGTKNADELQGFTVASSASASTIALRDGTGYLWANYFNQSSAQNENPVISQVMVTNSGDNYLRKASLAYFFEQCMLSGAVTLVADTGQAPPSSGPPGSLWIAFS